MGAEEESPDITYTAYVTRSTTLRGMNGAGNPISEAGREGCPCFLCSIETFLFETLLVAQFYQKVGSHRVSAHAPKVTSCLKCIIFVASPLIYRHD